MYRSDKADGGASSDDSSEEDTPLWRQKQEKFFRKQQGNTVAMRSSPTLPDVKSDFSTAQAPQKKKSNNIWGSVLTEQDLTQTMVRSAAVDKPDEVSFNERNVESYDFTKKYEYVCRADSPVGKIEIREPSVSVRGGTVPGRSIIDYEDAVEKDRDRGRNSSRHNRKRKADNSNDRDKRSSIHDRLGVKKLATTRLGEIDISVDMEVSDLTQKIADFLHEPKVEIIERIVTHVGKDFAIRLVQSTKETEESGGMYTLDGSRRRTPGGVYLTLLKQQPEWNKDVRKLIFVEDVEELMKHRKEKRKKAKRQRKRKKQGENQNDDQEICESRSRSNSKSRSRSNSSSSSKSAKKEVEEAMEDGEISEKKETKSRNNSGNFRQRESRKYESSEESDEEDGNRGKTNWSKPFNFEDELAAAKKLILEKSQKTENHKESEGMETTQEKGNDSGMTDLDTAEANVVDIEIGIDDTC